ncbi:MAG: hypothetical protein N3D84_03220, partial [Candidatus Woesearchaeota archaeon]|nr:hypothetical protein [Candidatus Woesearchaeota archaeon]
MKVGRRGFFKAATFGLATIIAAECSHNINNTDKNALRFEQIHLIKKKKDLEYFTNILFPQYIKAHYDMQLANEEDNLTILRFLKLKKETEIFDKE